LRTPTRRRRGAGEDRVEGIDQATRITLRRARQDVSHGVRLRLVGGVHGLGNREVLDAAGGQARGHVTAHGAPLATTSATTGFASLARGRSRLRRLDRGPGLFGVVHVASSAPKADIPAQAYLRESA